MLLSIDNWLIFDQNNSVTHFVKHFRHLPFFGHSPLLLIKSPQFPLLQDVEAEVKRVYDLRDIQQVFSEHRIAVATSEQHKALDRDYVAEHVNVTKNHGRSSEEAEDRSDPHQKLELKLDTRFFFLWILFAKAFHADSVCKLEDQSRQVKVTDSSSEPVF